MRQLLRLSLATALVTPLFAVLPAPTGAVARPRPVAPHDVRASMLRPGTQAASAAGDGWLTSTTDRTLATHQAVSAGLPASARAAQRVLGVTAPTAVTSEVAVIGVTWQRGSGATAVVQYRAKTAGSWGAWNAVDVDSAKGGDADAAEGGADRAGSDPVVVTGVTDVQARVLGPKLGAPISAELSVIDPGDSSADATASDAGTGTAAASAARPKVNPRSAWGADESLKRSATPTYAAVKGAVIHHTAGTNSYTPAQVPAILRGIYAFHVLGRKWDDIAYNFLVDKWGRIWEGRAGGIDQAVQGAHTKGHNAYVMGISLMGDYSTAKPSTAAVESIARIVAWKAGLHEFAPLGKMDLYGRSYNAVSGHRDIGQTDCPGRYLYAKLPWIRSRATYLMGYTPSLTLRRDLDNQGGSDILGRGDDGSLLIASATGAGTISSARPVGGDWSQFDRFVIAGDVDGDGDVDMFVRQVANGALLLVPGNSQGGFDAARSTGLGWNAFDKLIGTGDITGDGRPDLLATTSGGAVRLFPGTGGARFSTSKVVATGWQNEAEIAAVGDFLRDGRRSVVTIDRSGVARIREFSAGRLVATITMSGDFSGARYLTGVSDTNRDGRPELFWKDDSGAAWLGRRTSPTTVAVVSAQVDLTGFTPYGG